MSKPKVVITHFTVPNIALELLSKQFEVLRVEGDPPTRKELIESVKGADAIFWSSKEYFDKEFLDAAGSQLRVVSTMSVGIDHLDGNELRSRGILFGNTQNVLQDSVADVAVLLALAASRRAHEGWLDMTRGRWKYSVNSLLGQDINSSTVGIVGLGAIGMEIIKRLQGFRVGRFLYCGHNEKPAGKELGASFVPFDELLKQSDFVLVTCPFTTETENMFNDAAFGKMKKTAVFVNVARGQIVDQPALIRALENHTIFAAGLDVMTPEPLPPGHKLYSLPNCVLIPHLGSATVATRNRMAELAAQNIIAVFNNQPMPSQVL